MFTVCPEKFITDMCNPKCICNKLKTFQSLDRKLLLIL